MTDRAAFVAAIEADPDNDLPRLVFADWLDDTGDARNRVRAALIRVQCSTKAGTVGREQSLLTAVTRIWPAELRVPWREFRRGFPRGLQTTANDLANTRRRFAGREPMLDVELSASHLGFGPVDQLVRLAAGDDLWPVTRLDGYHLAPLFVSRHLERLTAVVTHSPTDICWMSRSPSPFALASLSVTFFSRPEPGVGREVADALACDPRYARLERLELHHVGLSRHEVAILVASRTLPPTAVVTVVEAEWRSDGDGPTAEALAARFPGPLPAG